MLSVILKFKFTSGSRVSEYIRHSLESFAFAKGKIKERINELPLIGKLRRARARRVSLAKVFHNLFRVQIIQLKDGRAVGGRRDTHCSSCSSACGICSNSSTFYGKLTKCNNTLRLSFGQAPFPHAGDAVCCPIVVLYVKRFLLFNLLRLCLQEL